MELIIAFVGIIWLLLSLGNEKLSLASIRSEKKKINEYRDYLKGFVATDEEFEKIARMVKSRPLCEYADEIEDDLVAMFGKDYYKKRADFSKEDYVWNPVTYRNDGRKLFVCDPSIELVAELILSKRGKIRDAISFQIYSYWGKETKRENMRLLLQRIEHNLREHGIDIEYVIVAEVRNNILTNKVERTIGSGCNIQPKKMCLSSSVTQRLW